MGRHAERIDGILAQGRLGSPEMSTGVQADEMQEAVRAARKGCSATSRRAPRPRHSRRRKRSCSRRLPSSRSATITCEQLQNAHEQIAELQRLLGRKTPAGAAGAGAGASVPHRAPPKAPPATQAQREATKAALERYGSAEYNASAPHPPSQHPGRR